MPLCGAGSSPVVGAMQRMTREQIFEFHEWVKENHRWFLLLNVVGYSLNIAGIIAAMVSIFTPINLFIPAGIAIIATWVVMWLIKIKLKADYFNSKRR